MADQADYSAERAYSFGPFRTHSARQSRLEAEQPCAGSRTRRILIISVERPGEPLGKDMLMARIGSAA